MTGLRPQNAPDAFNRAKWDAGMLPVHMAPDVIVPSQYRAKRSNERGQAERALLMDLLESALHDLSYRHVRGGSGLGVQAAAHAWTWLMDLNPDDGAGYSVVTVCDHLGLEPAEVRRIASEIRAGTRIFRKPRPGLSRLTKGGPL